jgi:hypothetical protein
MRTVVRLYLGWRLFRMLRPILVMALLVGVLLSLHAGHVATSHSAASTLKGGAVTAGHGLARALERAFTTSSR